jgi:hypothetical protein
MMRHFSNMFKIIHKARYISSQSKANNFTQSQGLLSIVHTANAHSNMVSENSNPKDM